MKRQEKLFHAWRDSGGMLVVENDSSGMCWIMPKMWWDMITRALIALSKDKGYNEKAQTEAKRIADLITEGFKIKETRKAKWKREDDLKALSKQRIALDRDLKKIDKTKSKPVVG